MLAREITARDEEEGADEEEGQEERVVGSAGAASEGSTCGRFAASYTPLCRIDFLLMTTMT